MASNRLAQDVFQRLVGGMSGDVLFFIIFTTIGIPLFLHYRNRTERRASIMTDALLLTFALLGVGVLSHILYDATPRWQEAVYVYAVLAAWMLVRVLLTPRLPVSAPPVLLEILRVLATRHQQGISFTSYEYHHTIAANGDDMTRRLFTVAAPDMPVSWLFFQTGATSDAEPAEFSDLKLQATDVTNHSQMQVIPVVDKPFDKTLMVVFETPIAVGSERMVSIDYRWQGAWRPLVQRLWDEAPLILEGTLGKLRQLQFTIDLAPGVPLLIQAFDVIPPIGSVAISADHKRVTWSMYNPPPNTYRWKIKCSRLADV